MFAYDKIIPMSRFKKDIILLSGICAVALLLWLIPFLLNRINQSAPAIVSIYQDGQKLADYPLSEDQTLVIPWEDKGYNLLLIEDGRAAVTDADCPDQLCVRQRSISRNGESIICLPHKLVLQIAGEEEGDLDAVTY